MRILHVVPSYIPAWHYGGPIVSVHGLCKGLAAIGHDVHVFTTNVDGPNDSNVPLATPVELEGVKIWYFPSKHLRRLYWSPDMAKALADQMRAFDLAHLHSIYLWPTWAAARAARRVRVPYVVALRGMLERDLIRRKSQLAKSAWIALIEKRNLEDASGIHVTSEREATEAAAFGLKLPSVYVVPNGVALEELASWSTPLSPLVGELIEGEPFLLFLGRINWEKGLDRLIAALQHVPGTRLVLAGNDEENYQPFLEAMAATHGLLERLTFTGWVHSADKAALLRHAQALVLPSYSENFGNVVLEAMAVGCPVVVTPEVGASNIVRETGCGVVVPGDPHVLGMSIFRLLQDPMQMRMMGQQGQRAVRERYGWDVVAKEMEAVYRRVVLTHRGHTERAC